VPDAVRHLSTLPPTISVGQGKIVKQLTRPLDLAFCTVHTPSIIIAIGMAKRGWHTMPYQFDYYIRMPARAFLVIGGSLTNASGDRLRRLLPIFFNLGVQSDQTGDPSEVLEVRIS
jgi:hypothetical protein